MNILNFFHAEFLWPYVTGEKDIPRNDSYLQKPTSNPSYRHIDYDFIDIIMG